MRTKANVAVKLLHTNLATHDTAAERFKREAEVTAQLDHPNIIKVFDFGEHGEDLYLAMEFLDGRTLGTELKSGPLSVARTLHILDQTLTALIAAHARDLVHRDLKPDNLFLVTVEKDPDFVKVLDFGIAKALEQDTITATGTIFGTPQYMSPEQCRGEDLDARSDLYSLGCIAYQMLSGRTPFLAKTAVGQITAHVTETPGDLRELVPTTPRGLAQWVMTLLQKGVAGRLPNAEVARDELRKLAGRTSTLGLAAPSGEDATTPAPRTTRPRSRPVPKALETKPHVRETRPSKVGWVVVAALGLGGMATAVVVSGSSADPAPPKDSAATKPTTMVVEKVAPDVVSPDVTLSERKAVEVIELLAYARTLAEAERWDQAGEKLRALLAIDPSQADAKALLLKVDAERTVGERFAEAQAAQAKADLPGAWAALQKLKDLPSESAYYARYQEARDAVQTALAGMYADEAQAAYDRRDWAEAQRLADETEKVLPGCVRAEEIHQKVLARKREIEREAKAAPAKSTTARELYDRGRSLHNSDTQAAMKAYEEAAAMGYAPAYKQLGSIKVKVGDTNGAVVAYKRYLQLVPEAPEADMVKDIIIRLGGTP